MNWILVVVSIANIQASVGQKDTIVMTAMQEFGSKHTCEFASELIWRTSGGHALASCVPK